MKPFSHPLPARLYYTDGDLLAYAHHVWVQQGMPCPRVAWDEASACFASNVRPFVAARGTRCWPVVPPGGRRGPPARLRI
ncbi:MAG: hypothetical protein WCQ89_02705 [Verrucomicrobiota bacterium]|jgi:hypothetical protein